MLGDKLGAESGKVTGRRVLPKSGRYEIFVQPYPPVRHHAGWQAISRRGA